MQATKPKPRKALLDLGYQSKAVKEMLEKLDRQFARYGRRAVMLRSATRTGKTYMIGQALQKLYPILEKPKDSAFPLKGLVVCPASLCIQWIRVLQLYGLAHQTLVLSREELRSTKGEMFIEWLKMPSLDGSPVEDKDADYFPTWRPHALPPIVVLDECQGFRNIKAQQTQAIVNLPTPRGVAVIATSATPFQTVEDSRWWWLLSGCVSDEHNFVPASQDTIGSLLRSISGWRTAPSELNIAAMGRLKKALASVTVDVKGIRYPFKLKCTVRIVPFKTAESEARYKRFFQQWLEDLVAMKKAPPSSQWGLRMAAETKFQQGAEIERKEWIADAILAALDQGKQVIVASKYLQSLRAWWVELVKVRNYPKELVSFVVGGQNASDRQAHVDAFQHGKTKVMFFTMRAGGIGLSMHHEFEGTLPRHIVLPPCYSAIDGVQASGRAHGPTSLSETTQEILYFDDTIEVKVAERQAYKVKCLGAAVEARESWMYMFEGRDASEDDVDRELLDENDDQVTGEGLDEATEVEIKRG